MCSHSPLGHCTHLTRLATRGRLGWSPRDRPKRGRSLRAPRAYCPLLETSYEIPLRTAVLVCSTGPCCLPVCRRGAHGYSGAVTVESHLHTFQRSPLCTIDGISPSQRSRETGGLYGGLKCPRSPGGTCDRCRASPRLVSYGERPNRSLVAFIPPVFVQVSVLTWQGRHSRQQHPSVVRLFIGKPAHVRLSRD